MENKQFAVITGASSGIGFELAKQFAQHGFDLLITAEDEGLNQAKRKLESLGCEVQCIKADLTRPKDVIKLYENIVENGRLVDAIAINAGVGIGGEFVKTDLRDELNIINLNVVSTTHLAKLIAIDMVKRGKGRILFTASIAATMPGPYEAVYAASKAYVLSLSQALHYELKDKGVVVTALMPGPTETNFFHRANMDNTKVGSQEKDDPAEVAKQGYEALMDGKDHVIAGSFKTRIMNTANDLIPEQTKARQHAEMAKPASAGRQTSY